jgi:predicted MPP superfamily phosphohydrolase
MRLLLISFFGHAYIGWRLVPALAAWPALQYLLMFALIVSAILVPTGLELRRSLPSRSGDRLTWLCMLTLGWFSSMFVVTLARELVLLVGTLLLAGPGLIDLPTLSRWTAALVVVLATLASIIGYRNARAVPALKQVDIPIDDLPAALDGFRIAQITDLHVGPTIKAAQMKAIVDVVNQLDVDFVAITGDLVDGPVSALAKDVAPLGGLRSRDGSFFVTGNHEYYSGATDWIAQVRSLGITVLMNSHVVLERNGAKLVLAGVTDFGAAHFDVAHRSDPVRALEGAPADAGIRILLAHQPRSARAAAAAGFDLQLSGHTHGGQFLPWNFFVRLQQPWVAGLERIGQMSVYISRGSGYWGPPKRLGAPSEITCIRLVASTAAARPSMPLGDKSSAATAGAAA